MPSTTATSANPAAVKRLPPPVHDAYVTAVTASLRPIFLVAAGAALVGFAIAWRLPEVRLRATAQAGAGGEGLPAPRDDDPLRQIEPAPTTQERLLEQLGVDAGPLAAALQRLRERSLVGDGDELITLTQSGRADYERLVTARCAGLRELLDGWNPDEHPELRRLIDELGRDLVSQIPAPAAAAARSRSATSGHLVAGGPHHVPQRAEGVQALAVLLSGLRVARVVVQRVLVVGDLGGAVSPLDRAEQRCLDAASRLGRTAALIDRPRGDAGAAAGRLVGRVLLEQVQR